MGGQDGHKGETLAPDSDFKEFLPNRSFFFFWNKSALVHPLGGRRMIRVEGADKESLTIVNV